MSICRFFVQRLWPDITTSQPLCLRLRTVWRLADTPNAAGTGMLLPSSRCPNSGTTVKRARRGDAPLLEGLVLRILAARLARLLGAAAARHCCV